MDEIPVGNVVSRDCQIVIMALALALEQWSKIKYNWNETSGREDIFVDIFYLLAAMHHFKDQPIVSHEAVAVMVRYLAGIQL